ncbi:FAD-dependent oxidoreductase [Acetobacterium paludosum]|uniref:FAD-dependent oxidoreductase n=1 Tax=Acetobacterium paludosum TaxID=52693 RepID=A0A923HYW2_9FIRM|nr:FAD-dependent oxidoreductase [Acetobacterium paludosum]MBC3889692.1 FAD-dependent oxidoreductase [Acetobacterium paludosum]
MENCKYPHLFSPIILGSTLFRNRIFASPTGYQNLNGDGYLNDGAAAYYERKARGGAASVTSFEGIVDGEFGRGGATHICLDTPNIKNNLSRIAYGVKTYGAVASLELQHTGMFANRDLSFFGASSKGIAYGPVECELGGRTIRPMDEAIIERTIRKFVDGAVLAKMCGFGMVTVHAGHGWMLHQFLSPITNRRTDKWGGNDVKNRARLLVTICDEIRKAVGPGFPIEVRISGSECYDGGFDVEDGISIAKELDGHCDLIHVSAGNHEIEEVFPVTHPSMFLEDGCNVEYAAEIKKHVKTPIATVGALDDPELMEEIIASGKADIVEMARGLLADPDFPNKVRSGKEDNVIKCMRCLSCFSSELTNGEPYCALNPETGRELEMKFAIPTAFKKKVLVVGGGIGGMQAALTCADRGHEVVLCEQSDRLGGVLLCEEDVAFKKNLEYYLGQQAQRINASDINLHLNTEVTPEYAQKINADVIIAALGAQPVKPRISGIDNANVMCAQDAYTAVDKIGDKVVIIGAGLVGVELGLHLIANGKKVAIVEATDHVNDGGNFLHMLGLKVEIKKRGLIINYNTKVKEIKAAGVLCEVEGAEKIVEADTVIYAVGQKPRRDETIALNFCAPEFYLVGDCITPRDITSANTEAFMTARNIGRF